MKELLKTKVFLFYGLIHDKEKLQKKNPKKQKKQGKAKSTHTLYGSPQTSPGDLVTL